MDSSFSGNASLQPKKECLPSVYLLPSLCAALFDEKVCPRAQSILLEDRVVSWLHVHKAILMSETKVSIQRQAKLSQSLVSGLKTLARQEQEKERKPKQRD